MQEPDSAFSRKKQWYSGGQILLTHNRRTTNCFCVVKFQVNCFTEKESFLLVSTRTHKNMKTSESKNTVN